MPLIDVVQGTPEWLAARRGKVTASVAHKILTNGRLAAYNEIQGITVKADNPFLRWGRDNEGRARAAYEIESGEIVCQTGLWVHWDHDWLAASPDGLIGSEGMVEIKCPETLPEAIPEAHECQMRVQMACADRMWCDYWAWTPQGSFCKRLTRDMTREVAIIKELRVFWSKFLVNNQPPPRRRGLDDASEATPVPKGSDVPVLDRG